MEYHQRSTHGTVLHVSQSLSQASQCTAWSVTTALFTISFTTTCTFTSFLDNFILQLIALLVFQWDCRSVNIKDILSQKDIRMQISGQHQINFTLKVFFVLVFNIWSVKSFLLRIFRKGIRDKLCIHNWCECLSLRFLCIVEQLPPSQKTFKRSTCSKSVALVCGSHNSSY